MKTIKRLQAEMLNVYYDRKAFPAGRIHGMTQALALIYGLEFSQVKDLLED